MGRIRVKFGFGTTSAAEAKTWDTSEIYIPKKAIKINVLSRMEYIKLDSLLHTLSGLSGNELINAYNQLALAYSLNDDKESFSYAEKALSLAKKGNYPKGIAMALYSIGNCQYVFDNYSDALVNQLSALRIFDSLELLNEAGNLLLQIASLHSYTGSFDLALKYQKRALGVFEEIKDTISIIKSLEYLGKSYLTIGDTTNAINAFRKRLYLANELKLIWEEGHTYRSLGNSYQRRSIDSSIY
jgi:tetratricopeptide (TPR) repeat protein